MGGKSRRVQKKTVLLETFFFRVWFVSGIKTINHKKREKFILRWPVIGHEFGYIFNLLQNEH